MQAPQDLPEGASQSIFSLIAVKCSNTWECICQSKPVGVFHFNSEMVAQAPKTPTTVAVLDSHKGEQEFNAPGGQNNLY